MSCSCQNCPCGDREHDPPDPLPVFERPDNQGKGDVRDARTREKLGEYQLPEGPAGTPMTPFQAYPARLLVDIDDPEAPNVGEPIEARAVLGGKVYLSRPGTQTIFHVDAREGEHFAFR